MTGERSESHTGGYRLQPRGGPKLRTDIVDVYVFRDAQGAAQAIELLLLKRAGEPLGGTWQPVMGHVEPGETATQTALRELCEEVGLRRTSADLLFLWALEQTHPYFVAAIDAIVLSPRFAVQVTPSWEPTLNSEHLAYKWVPIAIDDPASSCAALMWPSQKKAVEEIVREIVRPDSLSREKLAINPRDVPASPES